MKKYKILRLCLPLYILLYFSSCTKELNTSPTSIITNSSFWKTEDDVDGALAGMYVDLRNVASANLYLLGEARSEILTYGSGGQGGYDIYYFNTLHAGNAGPGWQQFYTIVNSANLLLKYVPGIEFKDETKKNNVLAQAYTMRAFAYFVMTRTWGDLAIHTEPIESSNAEVTQKARSPKEEVFNLIKEDLDKALELYPNNNFSSGRYLWSKPSANALKADVYLWTGKQLNGGASDFQIALNALNEVQKADVSLLPEFADVFEFENKGNKEFLMSVRFQEFEAGNNYFWLMWIHGSAVPGTIDDYARSIIFPVGSGQGIVIPSEVYRNQYTDDDTRKDATFLEIYAYEEPDVPTYNTSIVLKGKGLVNSGDRKFINDVILYRYADILLMKAEVKNALGQNPEAEINEVRRRAYGDAFTNHQFVNGSQVSNDEAILKERLLELAFEGKRWWDLVRFDKAFELVPSLQDRADERHLLLFPISESVLSLEPLMEQNPGY